MRSPNAVSLDESGLRADLLAAVLAMSGMRATLRHLLRRAAQPTALQAEALARWEHAAALLERQALAQVAEAGPQDAAEVLEAAEALLEQARQGVVCARRLLLGRPDPAAQGLAPAA